MNEWIQPSSPLSLDHVSSLQPLSGVEGPFRTGRVSFSTYCHSWFISQIKLLASLSRWPDDLGCHVFIQAKWLVLWNISIGVTHKRPSLGKKEKSFLLGHLITQQSQSSDSCKKMLPGILMSTQSILALLFNMNDQEKGTISKHSGARTRYIKA